MSYEVLLISVLAFTVFAVFAVVDVNRRIQRRRQLAFLTGPLREHLRRLSAGPDTSRILDAKVIDARPPAAPLCYEPRHLASREMASV
jgi:hypothetical protein